MKWLALFAVFSFNAITFAGDHEGGIHTENYCSTTNEKTCAHLRFEKWPTSTEASEFIVHVISPSNSQVTDVKVKLWMDMNGHGHGSSPVKIETLEEMNHFFIQDAYFVMRGNWQVIVNFTDAGLNEKIIIPLSIKE